MENALSCLCLQFSSTRDKMPAIDVKDLETTLTKYGQLHLLSFFPRLTPEQRTALTKDIQSIDLEAVMKAFSETSNETSNKKLDEHLQPIPEELHEGVQRCSPDQLKDYRDEGLRQISKGKVAALLLAGGQGTRLGVKYPKGMFDVGLPSKKPLFQLQAERIRRLEELAFEMTGVRKAIPWYIMTSEHTMQSTLAFFAEKDYFGLKEENIIVFEQYTLPCLTFDGKIILETPWKIAKAPDGNGGLFRALEERGILDDMMSRGIECVQVYCVDNILVKMVDPVFTGYCIRKGANCAAKVVEKASPEEKVGIVCKVNDNFKVVEYSEISEETSEKRSPDGRLTFNAGNICNHFFTVKFLKDVGGGNKLKYHVAKKKITCINEDGVTVKPLKPNGVKLERFVFDCFPLSKTFAAWEVLRNEEFSPLKNSDDCDNDTPTTARNALYALHRRYVESAGGKFANKPDKNENANGMNGDVHDGICEISPLLSYAGEGLEEIVKGKTFTTPTLLLSPCEQQASKKQNGYSKD